MRSPCARRVRPRGSGGSPPRRRLAAGAGEEGAGSRRRRAVALPPFAGPAPSPPSFLPQSVSTLDPPPDDHYPSFSPSFCFLAKRKDVIKFVRNHLRRKVVKIINKKKEGVTPPLDVTERVRRYGATTASNNNIRKRFGKGRRVGQGRV